MTALTIRSMLPADAAALGRIDAATWTPAVGPSTAPDGGPLTVGAGVTVLVAEHAGESVGYTMFRRPTGLATNAHVRLVCGLAVSPAHRGLGVAKQLIDAAAAAARREGATRLRLHVLAPNQPARRLYERCGFRVEGVLEGEFLRDGQPVDDVLMARQL